MWTKKSAVSTLPAAHGRASTRWQQLSAGTTMMAAMDATVAGHFIHHRLVLEAPLIKRDGAWGALQLLPDRIEVLGRGGMQSRTLIIGKAASYTN